MDHFINYGSQWIDQNDIQEVVATLTSNYLTQGPKILEFENAICRYTGAKYSVAVSNATAGLQLAVQSLKIVNGAEGITSPNTFVASSNSLIYNGLKPVFADIDPESYNIDPEKIEERITDKTRVLIPVHFAGRPSNMREIKKIASNKGLYIIEDAAHAIGSQYADGRKVGTCCYSDLTVFSFHPVKTVTTGEGGVVTTNNKELYERLLLLRSHGITKDPDFLSMNPGPWYYEMQDLGYNYRMTDLQAALGLSQLSKLDEYKKRRIEIIEQYNRAFSYVTWIKTPLNDNEKACFHLYVVKIDFERIGTSRAEVMIKLRRKKIGTQVHYIPVHTQPYYQKMYNYKWGDYPKAEEYYSQALSLPLYPRMSEEDVNYVIDEICGLAE